MIKIEKLIIRGEITLDSREALSDFKRNLAAALGISAEAIEATFEEISETQN